MLSPQDRAMLSKSRKLVAETEDVSQLVGEDVGHVRDMMFFQSGWKDVQGAMFC